MRGGAGIGGDLYVGRDIYGLGEITAYYGATSDRRLKTNIGSINNGLAKVLTLDGIVYNWNELANKDLNVKEAGVIAQQIQAVLPEAISITMVKDDETNTEYLGVSYTDVIPLLVASIKELKTLVDAQSALITGQAAEIVALKAKVGL